MIFLLGFYFLPSLISTAEANKEFIFKDEGVTCRIPRMGSWERLPSLFGFSALLVQKAKSEAKATLGFVITPLTGEGFDNQDIEKQFKDFQEAKAEFVKEEGGEFLSVAESLKGENGLYRVSVKYRVGEVDYRDSSYFVFAQGRFIHGKAMFPFQEFDEIKIENEIQKIMSEMTCDQ
jgi:hypothetical protein